jgi:hypothetical protein
MRQSTVQVPAGVAESRKITTSLESKAASRAADAGALGAGHEVGLGEVETVDLVHLDYS